ncbi:MAG TPA: enoyl-CoA hydratase-related protein [Aldersonia sp.]
MTATLSVDNGLATITLARPDASNALDADLKATLHDAVVRAGNDDSVRAVLLRADGKNFCVGQDLAEHIVGLDADPTTAMATVAKDYNPLIRALAALDVPVVVAINGACVGAGLGIALAGDIRIVADNATFATAFTGIALAADSGLSHTLVAALGPSRAAGLMLLGDRFTAAQAAEWGLAHRVVDAAHLDEAARTLAVRLAAGPTAAYRQVKALIGRAGLDAALDRETVAQEALGTTADHRSAVDAFLAKSRPTFVGH